MIILRNKILVVMPTRHRPAACLTALASIVENSIGYADVLLCVDPDDTINVEMVSKGSTTRITTQVMDQRKPMLQILNEAVKMRLDHYAVFGFTGDDVIYETKGWDAVVWAILRHQVGIVYGNDHIQGEKLPSHPWFSAEIVKATGHTAPPCLRHYYFDNYMKAIGQGLNALHWRPDLVTRHRHHSVGGIKHDTVYRDAERSFQLDKADWLTYQAVHLEEDLSKIRAWMEITGLTAAGAASPPDTHTPKS